MSSKRSERHSFLENAQSIDDFLIFGKYCIYILLFSESMILIGAGNTLFMMFAGASPKLVACENSTTNFCMDPGNCTVSYVYDFYSVNIEFQKLCTNDASLVKSSISVQMFGVLIGSLLGGTLADKYGRLKIIFICYILLSILSIVTSVTWSLLSFTIARFILSIFTGGLLSVYGVYKMEHIPKQHRFWIANIISWAPNYMLLSIVAFMAKQWRIFELAIFFISIPGAFFYFFIHESPRWLIQVGKYDQAKYVLSEILKIDGTHNQTTLSQIDSFLEMERLKISYENNKNRFNISDLFKNKYVSSVTVTLCLGIFTTSFTNYGFVFNMEKLSGSLYVNALLMGSLRWIINIVFGILDIRFKCIGRKLVHFITKMTISVSVFIIFFIYYCEIESQYNMIIRISTLVASATASQVYITKTMVLLEFYPTYIRSSAMSIKSTCSRIGTILGPFLFILNSNKSMSYLILAIICALDAILFQIHVPETKGTKLPDTIKDGKMLNKRKYNI